MKNHIIKKLIFSLILTTLIATGIFAAGGAKEALSDSDLNLENMLKYALEDERNAQAEYEAIIEKFDVLRPFDRILKAEKRHEARILNLYEDKNLDVPETESIQVELPETLEESVKLAIEAEINNIKMYESFLNSDIDEETVLVFEKLKNASERHLKAFERLSSGEGCDGTCDNKEMRKGKFGKEKIDKENFGARNNVKLGVRRGFAKAWANKKNHKADCDTECR